MKKLQSPWTHQIKRSRELSSLNKNHKANVCIVGGGISGVVSAYYILKHTSHSVILLEAHQVAHGATGHNAGQLVGELERSVSSIVAEFGLPKTIDLLRSIDSAWGLLEEILHEANLDIPYSTFMGYNIFTTEKQIVDYLHDLALLHEGGLHNHKLLVSDAHISDLNIPEKLKQYTELVPHESILSLGETINPQYIAAYPLRKGCLNSALLTEKLVNFLIATYGSDRFSVYEETPVTNISLHNGSAKVTSNEYVVECDKVLLCTNGFENFTINDVNSNINMNFHKNLKGNIGYMFARTEKVGLKPSANAYFEKSFDEPRSPSHDISKDIVYGAEYVYATRRPYDLSDSQPKNLFCLGGRGLPVEDTSIYNKEHVYQESVLNEYVDFIQKNFSPTELDEDHQEFIWHGLMGYTANGLRLVGFEKRNPVLMYNLGCNGIGILPAIWGGLRISNLLNGEKTESLFDPK